MPISDDHQRPHENEPVLLNPLPLNVWREVYNGRWTELRTIQKAEFVVEVLFMVVILFCFLVFQLFHEFAGTVLVWGGVISILLVFFFVLTRSVK